MIDARWVAGLMLTNALALAGLLGGPGAPGDPVEQAQMISTRTDRDAPEPFSDGPRCPLCDLDGAL